MAVPVQVPPGSIEACCFDEILKSSVIAVIPVPQRDIFVALHMV
jgi:hypothetical protein